MKLKNIIPSLLIILFVSFPSVIKADEIVTKTMEVPYNEPTLSSITKVINNTAYVKIIYTLAGTDEVYLWSDIQLIRELYPNVTDYKIYLDCYGGVAKSGFAVGDMLAALQKEYNVEVEASGIVASAAMMIFLSVEKRSALPNTMFMVHEIGLNPSSESSKLSAGDVKSLDRMFDLMTERYLDVLCRNSNLPRQKWSDMIEDTTYFWTHEAIEWGLIKEEK